MTVNRNQLRRLAHFAGTCAVAVGCAHAAAQSPPEKVALVGGRIIPVVGEDIENGTILIERGRIIAVGENVEIPYDAMEVDVTGRVLMPGMINPHSPDGLDVPNENVPVAAFLDVYDAIDPSDRFFEDSLRDGVTTVHVIVGNSTVIGGVSRAVRPIGMTVDEMTVAPDLALKLSATPMRGYDRMRQQATFREAFAELDDYLLKLAEKKYEETLAEEDKKIDVGPAEASERGKELITSQDYDDQHRNLVRLRSGEIPAWCYAELATDIRPAVELAKAQGYLDHTVFVLGQDAHRAVKEIAASGRPVVLPEDLVYRDTDRVSGKIKETFIPSVFYEAGVKFALQPNPRASMAERYLNYQAAMCIRNGIPRQAALEAITINPATMMGLGDRLGSLESGKVANIVILSGDPFDFSTWVEQVYVDGVLAYDRASDPRLRNLLDLEAWSAKQDAAESMEESGDVAESEGDQAGDEAGAEAGGDDTGSGGDGGGEGDG